MLSFVRKKIQLHLYLSLSVHTEVDSISEVGRVTGTDSNVVISGLSAVEVVLGEELGQLWLDAAQRLVLTMKQHHQV